MRRDFEALEKRRMSAVRLFATQLNNSEIGSRLRESRFGCSQQHQREDLRHP